MGYFNKLPFLKKILFKLEETMYMNADGVIVQSDESKEYISKIIDKNIIFVYKNFESNKNIHCRKSRKTYKNTIRWVALVMHKAS